MNSSLIEVERYLCLMILIWTIMWHHLSFWGKNTIKVLAERGRCTVKYFTALARKSASFHPNFDCCKGYFSDFKEWKRILKTHEEKRANTAWMERGQCYFSSYTNYHRILKKTHEEKRANTALNGPACHVRKSTMSKKETLKTHEE